MAVVKRKTKVAVIEPKTNANVTKGTKTNQTVIKEESPLDHAVKHGDKTIPNKSVGINLGVTLNMGDYESLRVDVWCTDLVRPNETHEDAMERVSSLARARLDVEIEEIRGE